MKRKRKSGVKTFFKILGLTFLVGVLVWTGLYFAFPKVKNWTNEKVFKIEQEAEISQEDNSEEIANLEAQIATKNETIKTLTADLNTTRASVERLQSEAEADAKTIATLQTTITAKEEALATALSEKSELEAKKAELEADVQNKVEEIAELESEAEANAETISALQLDISEAQTEIAELEAKGESDSATIAALQSDVTAKQNQISELEAQVESDAQTIANLQNEVTTKQTRITELETQAETDAETIADLQTNLTNTQNELTNVNSQLEAKTTEATNLSSELATVTAERDDLTTSLAEKNSQIETLQADIETKETELAQKNSEINALNVEIAELEKVIYEEGKIYFSQLLESGQEWVKVETPQGTYVSPTSTTLTSGQYSGLWRLYTDQSVEKVHNGSKIGTGLGYHRVDIINDNTFILNGYNEERLIYFNGEIKKLCNHTVQYLILNEDTILLPSTAGIKYYTISSGTSETVYEDNFWKSGIQREVHLLDNNLCLYYTTSSSNTGMHLLNLDTWEDTDLLSGAHSIGMCEKIAENKYLIMSSLGLHLLNSETKTVVTLLSSNSSSTNCQYQLEILSDGNCLLFISGYLSGIYYINTSNSTSVTYKTYCSYFDYQIVDLGTVVLFAHKDGCHELKIDSNATFTDFGISNPRIGKLDDSSAYIVRQYNASYVYNKETGLTKISSDGGEFVCLIDDYLFVSGSGTFVYKISTGAIVCSEYNSIRYASEVVFEDGMYYLYSHLTEQKAIFDPTNSTLTLVTESVA